LPEKESYYQIKQIKNTGVQKLDKKEEITIDQVSYQLGMITAFAEMVGAGVKKLGLSPPFNPEKLNRLKIAADKVAETYGVHFYLEKEFLTTDLFDPEFTRGKYVLLIYQNPEVKDSYMALKAEKAALVKSGQFHGESRRKIARKFGLLLCYQEDHIEKMLSKVPT
jgi:hypothetical protein